MVVKRLNVQAKSEGQFVWDGKDENGNAVPSGIYFVKSAGNELKMNSKIIKID